MSKKNLLIIAGVLVVLAFVSQWFTQSGNKSKDEKIGQPILEAALVEAFDELILEDSKGVVRIKKAGDTWGVQEKNNYPVDMGKMMELVGELTQTKVASLVTKDEKRLAHFKVVYRNSEGGDNNTAGTQLTLQSEGKVVFKMMAGKKRDSKSSQANMPTHSDGQYIRIGDQKSVYLSKNDFILETDPKEWIKSTLFSIDKKEIEAVQFKSKSDSFELKRAEKGKELLVSTMKENEEIETYERNSIESDLESFSIEDIFESSLVKRSDLELQSTVTVNLYNDAPLSFNVYRKLLEDPIGPPKKEEEKEYIYFVEFMEVSDLKADSVWNEVQQLGKQWMFKLEEWKANRWIRERSDFVKEKE